MVGDKNMKILTVIWILVYALEVGKCDDSEEADRGVSVVWARVGGEVSLPCDVTAKDGDTVSMVMWFKDTSKMPLYTLDFREGPVVHWATTDDLGSRTHFVLDDNKAHEARLSIKSISRLDEGLFRCRVDFSDSPTRNSKVNLSLVVSSVEPKIFDAQGREITGLAGPFQEEYDLFLSCRASGGKPRPEVTWWHNDILLDSIEDPTSPEGTVTGQLFISTVTRALYNARLQCRSQVSALVPPVVKEIQLLVYLKPLNVHIVTPNELLSAGRPQALRCETTGSNPPAKLSWLLDGEVIRNQAVTESKVGNGTSSIATLILSSSDDGKELTCRSINPRLPGGLIEERRTIRVAYPPRVTLSVGSSDDPHGLNEGGEVQLICNAEAMPAVGKYEWYRENDQLVNDPAEGLIVLGRTMRIRNLTKDDSGNYSCKATNTEGTAKSQTLTLKVLYTPICKGGHEPKEVAALKHVPLILRCEVDSPAEAGQVKFSWTYNKTRDVLPVPVNRVNSNGMTSELSYAPTSAGDFGTLACWATNAIGNQRQACLFNIIPAKLPDPPRECNLVNESKALEVICQAGADGGIPQHFVLEVLDGVHHPLHMVPPANDEENEISTMNDQGAWTAPLPIPVHREAGESPRFTLRGLRPGRKYGLLVYAVNAKGRSAPASMHDITVSESLADQLNNQIGAGGGEDFNLSSSESIAMIFGALIAATFLIILAIVSASAVVLCKRNSGGCGSGRNKRHSESGPSMYASPDDDCGFGLHFGTPNVMIRPCADIRRDARRTSRVLSSLISREDEEYQPAEVQAVRTSQDLATYVDHQGQLYVPEVIQEVQRMDVVPQGAVRVPSFDGGYAIPGGMVDPRRTSMAYSSFQDIPEDQVLRFPENKIARVEITNKSDAGTVVRFELSKPDLISQ